MNRPPSVDSIARSLESTGLPQPLCVDAARAALAAGRPQDALEYALRLQREMLTRVINGTGVLLHTNMGRAPFAHTQQAAYVNLELDLHSGKRGSRRARTGPLLARACGAEDALVVNNGAGAVLLVLSALARGRGVAVSRGELVEIGGGFRLPDVMAESGAHMIEVGTTNRTRADDYARVAGETTLILKVHASNYRIVGFTSSASVAELVRIGPPVVVDLGSGLLDARCPWLPDGPPSWLAGEPAARQTLEAGAALVIFSGDKLLGGPQAGVIAGRADLVAACASHPLYRALRPGGLILSAMEQVALAYLRRDAHALPFWRMVTTPVDVLRERAQCLVGSGTRRVTTAPCESLAGGGSAPGMAIPSWGLVIEGDHLTALRSRPLPIIARVRDDRTTIDLRTVDPADDGEIGAALRALLP